MVPTGSAVMVCCLYLMSITRCVCLLGANLWGTLSLSCFPVCAAHELARDQRKNFGDDIMAAIRLAKKRVCLSDPSLPPSCPPSLSPFLPPPLPPSLSPSLPPSLSAALECSGGEEAFTGEWAADLSRSATGWSQREVRLYMQWRVGVWSEMVTAKHNVCIFAGIYVFGTDNHIV